MNQKTKQILIFIVGLAAAIGLDQWTKYLAVIHLKDQQPFIIWEGVFELYYSENRGAAFGMLQGRQGFFFLVGIVVILAVIYALYKMPVSTRFRPLTFCLLLITAGAMGNMIDRILQGFVVDFLYFSLINFPIFNVADCYVTIATAILVVLLLVYYKEEELEIFSPGKKRKNP